MSYCGFQKSKDMASGTTVDVLKKKLNQLLVLGALHAVEDIQTNRLISQVTRIGAFFARNLGN